MLLENPSNNTAEVIFSRQPLLPFSKGVSGCLIWCRYRGAAALFMFIRLLLVILLLSPAAVSAGTYVADTMAAAQSGDPDSQYALALLYEYGNEGLAKDKEKALKWFGKAAKKQLPGACFYLGLKYEYGNGVPRDTRRAACLYLCAARYDWPAAQVFLADMYENGRGVPQSFKKALVLLQSAAEFDYPGAKKSLERVWQLSEFTDMADLKGVEQQLYEMENAPCN